MKRTFPAYCINLDAKRDSRDKEAPDARFLVLVRREKDFMPGVHEYVRPQIHETMEQIVSKATPHDQFMALKAKGWTNLNKQERALFQELKLQEDQLIEPVAKN